MEPWETSTPEIQRTISHAKRHCHRHAPKRGNPKLRESERNEHALRAHKRRTLTSGHQQPTDIPFRDHTSHPDNIALFLYKYDYTVDDSSDEIKQPNLKKQTKCTQAKGESHEQWIQRKSELFGFVTFVLFKYYEDEKNIKDIQCVRGDKCQNLDTASKAPGSRSLSSNHSCLI